MTADKVVFLVSRHLHVNNIARIEVTISRHIDNAVDFWGISCCTANCHTIFIFRFIDNVLLPRPIFLAILSSELFD